MNRIEMIYFSKQTHVKSKKLEIFGLISGLLTLLTIVGALTMLFLDWGDSAIEKIVYGFYFIDVSLYFFTAVTLSSLAYLVFGSIAMFKKSQRNSVNYNFVVLAILAMAFFLTAVDYMEGIYYDLFTYLIFGAFAVRFIYSIVTMRATSKVWEATDKKLNVVGIMPFIVSLITLAGFLFLPLLVAKIGLEDILGTAVEEFSFFNGDLPHYFLVLFYNYASSIGLLYTSIEYIIFEFSLDAILSLVFALFGILLVSFLAVVVLSLIANLFKIGLNANAVRGNKYFKESSPFRTAFVFICYAIIYHAIRISVILINGPITDVEYAITFLSDVIYGSSYVSTAIFTLILSIVYTCIIANDKRKVRKIPVVIEEPKEEVLDQSETVVEEAEVPEEPVVEEVVEPVIEEPVVEEPVVEPEEVPVEEPVVEENKEETEDKEEKEEKKQDASQSPFVFAGMPNGYAIPMYNPATGQTVYCVPFGNQMQPMVQPIIQQAPQPIVVHSQPVIVPQPYGYAPQQPYGYAPQQPYGYPPQQPYGYAPQQPYGYAPQQPQQPQQAQSQAQPQPQPAYTEPVADDVDEDGQFQIVKKTLAEKVAELSATERGFYNKIIAYANGKVGVKYNKGTYADTVSYGRDLIVKVQVKQGKIVCNFQLVDFKVKEMLKNKDFDAKQEKTVIKVKDKASFEAVKNSIDMAYELALQAKEARHQEQLRKRREARAAKKNA